MVDYETVYLDLKKILSKDRFLHSIGVVERALEYARVYNVNEEIVMIVAICHDIAKELDRSELDFYLKKYNVVLSDDEVINSDLLHAKIGSLVCKDKYGFSDDMVNAVRYHTTGRENMSLLEKVIYLADKTEKGRKYCTSYYVDIIKDDIDRGIVELNKWVIKNLVDFNRVVSIDGIKCYNYYCSKVSRYEK